MTGSGAGEVADSAANSRPMGSLARIGPKVQRCSGYSRSDSPHSPCGARPGPPPAQRLRSSPEPPPNDFRPGAMTATQVMMCPLQDRWPRDVLGGHC